MHIFPSFLQRPQKVLFSHQDPDEHIEVLLRQHWFSLVPVFFTTLFLILVPFFISFLISYFGFLPITLPENLKISFWTLWYLMILIYLIEKFLFWYFNVFILTNKHLVDIDFNSLLSQKMVQFQLGDVESAQAKTKGIFSTYLGFGDVEIQTEATSQLARLDMVPRPREVADLINSFKERFKNAS